MTSFTTSMNQPDAAVLPFSRTSHSKRLVGGGVSFVGCLSHLIIDHISLSRRSTVPTPNRHLQRLGAHRVFPIHYIETLSLILSPSCFAVCGHHLSPRIGIAVSLRSSVPNYFSTSHSSIFRICTSNTSRSSCYISHPPTM